MKRLIALTALCFLCATALVGAQAPQEPISAPLQQPSGGSVQGTSQSVQSTGNSGQSPQALEQLSKTSGELIPLPEGSPSPSATTENNSGLGLWNKILAICLSLGVFVILLIIWGARDTRAEKARELLEEKRAKDQRAKIKQTRKAKKSKPKSRKKKKAHR